MATCPLARAPIKKSRTRATPGAFAREGGGYRPPDTASVRLLDLRRMAGNRAVSSMVDEINRGVLQRVEVKEDKMSET